MKKGLVVEGGAMRAVFACGCMDALLDHNIEFDYFIGVSAGLANGMSFISKQPKRNIEIATEYCNDKRYMGFRNFLDRRNKSYFGIDFMFRVIPRILKPFDYETFNSFPGEVIAVVSNVETGKAEYHNLMGNPLQEEYLLASCSLPMMFPVCKINGKGYLDGGLCDPVPIQRAIADGCDKILVLLTREKGYRKKSELADRAAIRLFKENKNFVNALVRRPELYNYSVDITESLEKNGRIKVIRPLDTKDFSRTEKNVEKMWILYQEGYDSVVERLEEIRAYFEQ